MSKHQHKHQHNKYCTTTKQAEKARKLFTRNTTDAEYEDTDA